MDIFVNLSGIFIFKVYISVNYKNKNQKYKTNKNITMG